MIFAVNAAEDLAKAASGIVGEPQAAIGAHEIDAIDVFGVEIDAAVVHGPRVLAGEVLPALAAVQTAENAAGTAGVGFDDGVDRSAVAGKSGEADAALVAARQAIEHLRPGGAAVGGAINSAARSAAVKAPALALPLIQGSENHLGIARIHGQIDGAGVLVLIENSLPGGAAVGGFVDTAFGVGSP